ncbi:putative oxidoreductase [Thermomonospora echinospora]|uniref:Putative oxidoreductase n=1 Tax=Thermomonospora echinospora TaxID=1992 RepID=A0A1H6E9D7_9ACTN|nr:DoxX family protein [Thermomonospora echinospora]SEG93554.1 putative oxidoreductase [Thermomonospora echinospora]
MIETDLTALLLRATVGATMIAHGWNHAFGGGRLAGTARWFESIGIKPGRVHAALATATELGAGVLLLVGLGNAAAAGAVLGTMLVALVANHLRNGFFIFNKGEGYEYVLMISVVALALAALGPGRVSLDHLLGLQEIAGHALTGWTGLLTAAAIGAGGATALLALCWRPTDTGPAS